MKKLLVTLALLMPLTAFATEKDIHDFCINIMPEMTRTSGLTNLYLIPEGYNLSNANGAPSVNCMYSAVTSGGTSVTVFATLNLSNKKLTFEID